ncbi:MAG: hypothetical protein KJO11_10725 [Gemmatimonadetes bacterium]|nr:hypothetical protein [Gemmatimonadota bacterium]
MDSGRGAPHAELRTSPGCWALYTRVMATEYADPGRWPIHGLTLDAYTAQHAGDGSRAAVAKVGVHLVALSLVVERDLPLDRAARIRSAAADRLAGGFTWLEPPAPPAPLTIGHVAGASDTAEHHARVREWAAAVWSSWAPHHETVHRWIDWLVAASPPDLAAALPLARESHGST